MPRDQIITLDLLFYKEPVTVLDVLTYIKCELHLVNAHVQIVDMDGLTSEIEVRAWGGEAEIREWMPLLEAAEFIVDQIRAQEQRDYQEVLQKRQEVGDGN